MPSLAGNYTNANYQNQLGFGNISHWVQPWRAYLETLPAAHLVNGLGCGLTNQTNPDLVIQHLAKNGITGTRFEWGWGSGIDYNTETISANNGWIPAVLNACKKYGVRPVITFNGNTGIPCPMLQFNLTLASAASQGATSVTFTSTSGIVVGYTGLSNLAGQYWAAQCIVTALNGNTATLAKPLPQSLNAGQSVLMCTLKYRPFSPTGSTDYNNTIAGWKRYVGYVNGYAAAILGTGGFDLEVWNELTFGSDFLYINHYYTVNPVSYGTGNEQDIFDSLPGATGDYAAANSAAFAGVEIETGMSNTIPDRAASTLNGRLSALGKHCYPRYLTFPANEQGGNPVSALGVQETPQTTFVPSYHASFPEWSGTTLQTECILRDGSPITSQFYNVNHGRYSRSATVPVWVWSTEIGWNGSEDGVSTANSLLLKARTTLRFFAFFLNKSHKKLILYGTADGNGAFGIVQDNFITYANGNSVYPADDTAYTSPSLLATRRFAAPFKVNLNAGLTATNALTVTGISDTHSHAQFTGDGSAAHPNLFDREVLAILPFQVNSARFVIPYYVMTRDIRTALTPEAFTVGISGFPAGSTAVSVYDPLNDATVPVTVNSFSGGALSFTANATDYPYLLVVDAPAGPTAPAAPKNLRITAHT